MSDLVGNPEDRFSRDAAHMVENLQVQKNQPQLGLLRIAALIVTFGLVHAG